MVTVREALEKAIEEGYKVPLMPTERTIILLLAPKIEAALRATAEEMLEYADDYWGNLQSRLTVAERQMAIDKCVTAGIEAIK